MAVSDEAGKAFTLIQGIDVCKQADAGFWRSLVTRIVLDLDREPGAERMMVRVRELLGQMWDALPDKPGLLPGEPCGCRCENPKGKCGCCGMSLIDGYTLMGDGSDEPGGEDG